MRLSHSISLSCVLLCVASCDDPPNPSDIPSDTALDLASRDAQDLGHGASDMPGDLPAPSSGRVLTTSFLEDAPSFPEYVPSDEFAPRHITEDIAAEPLNASLTLAYRSGSVDILRLDALDAGKNLMVLPAMTVELSTSRDGHVIPSWRGLRRTDPGDSPWDVIVGPGRVWREAEDGPWSRVAMPFSLVERGQNCTHHGLLTFLHQESSTFSPVRYQITQETCLYTKADFSGWLDVVDVTPKQADERVLRTFASREEAMLPVRPLDELTALGLDADAFGASFTPEHVTAQGVILDGTHYLDACTRRRGVDPFCAHRALPSYSTAKTAFTGLAWLRAALTSDVMDLDATPLPMLIPEADASWTEVHLSHVLDMTSGHYDSAAYMVDESARRQLDFFFAVGDAARLEAALAYPAQSPPGSVWAYQTSSTFLDARMLQALVGEDLHDWVVRELYEPLGLGDAPRSTLRTEGGAAQPLGGYGLWWRPRDLAALTTYLLERARGEGEALVEASALAEVMQRVDPPQGVVVGEKTRYHRTFWATAFGPEDGFECTVWVPFMSGFGGVTVAMFPNDTAYWVVSDHGEFVWVEAARALHEWRSMCPDAP